MSDLFQNKATTQTYTAQDIEVLEGLEPVRRRPGMYIGGTDLAALHHLAIEVLDNAMDEAVAGHANRIDVILDGDGYLTIQDNGRGIPTDPHPKYPDKSALEVILTMLHSGGKFSGKSYETSGGLHGVGVSVVNALSDDLVVEVARDRQVWRQCYSKGNPLSKLEIVGQTQNRRGTLIKFHPDPEIFGNLHFQAAQLYRMVRSKAYLFGGVEIRWSCDERLLTQDSDVPSSEILHFPQGLEDFMARELQDSNCLINDFFKGNQPFADEVGRVEWVMAWPLAHEGFLHSYCNTILTPLGGTHENGFRQAVLKGLRGYGELTGQKKAAQLTADDILKDVCVVLSAFIREPHFQGQTKEKLVSNDATRKVETVVRDHFDHWLSRNKEQANAILEQAIGNMEDRLSRKESKDTARASATRRLRLPGKLTDCTSSSSQGTEIFLVEGDSAGGTAKQARNRVNQAVLPLRGKILNVASATTEKLKANQELNDLALALGTGMGRDFDLKKLRYEKVIVMTDADVDGAHIASLLITFFFQHMRPLIENGHLFLAQPPLYRVTNGGKTTYVRDDAAKEKFLKTAKGKVEISRFKGLGEMPALQLRETTMHPEKRILVQLSLDDDPGAEPAHEFVEKLMGKKPEQRFQFIQANAAFVKDLDV